jgi:hypothetical protein
MRLLKLAREVTLIADAHSIHDLLNTQKRGPQKFLGLLHSQ